jgi:hypothetical protein
MQINRGDRVLSWSHEPQERRKKCNNADSLGHNFSPHAVTHSCHMGLFIMQLVIGCWDRCSAVALLRISLPKTHANVNYHRTAIHALALF